MLIPSFLRWAEKFHQLLNATWKRLTLDMCGKGGTIQTIGVTRLVQVKVQGKACVCPAAFCPRDNHHAETGGRGCNVNIHNPLKRWWGRKQLMWHAEFGKLSVFSDSC